jgi:hypothetical protein
VPLGPRPVVSDPAQRRGVAALRLDVNARGVHDDAAGEQPESLRRDGHRHWCDGEDDRVLQAGRDDHAGDGRAGGEQPQSGADGEG